MDNIFKKPFDEEFARICLKQCFPELGWNLILNEDDPPDLIDNENSIGVEVSKSIIESDAEADALYSIYVGKCKTEIPEGAIKKVTKGNNRFIFRPAGDKEVLWACLHGARRLDYSSEIKNIKNKTEKLNSVNYDHYDINALFILDEEAFIFEKGIEEILDHSSIFESEFDKKYDYFLIYCAHDIYFLDVKKRAVSKKIISDDEIEEMKRMALINLERVPK